MTLAVHKHTKRIVIQLDDAEGTRLAELLEQISSRCPVPTDDTGDRLGRILRELLDG
jgi:hypothetical protein